MSSMNYLGRLFEHMYWADDRVLKLLSQAPAGEQGAARRLFHHVLAAERVWLLRLRGEDSSVQAIWPALGPAEERDLAAANRIAYRQYIEALDGEDLQKWVEYTNQQGRAYRTAIGDILTHVALHGAYHRGQVARAIRESGSEPVNTDYITFVRELDEATTSAPDGYPETSIV